MSSSIYDNRTADGADAITCVILDFSRVTFVDVTSMTTLTEVSTVKTVGRAIQEEGATFTFKVAMFPRKSRSLVMAPGELTGR